MPVQLSVDIIH